jgi:hypothetical protein
VLPRELDKNQKSYCLFPMMIDTRWGGEARNDRRLLVNLVQAGVGETKSSTPAWEAFSRRQRVNRERPNPMFRSTYPSHGRGNDSR